MSNSKQNHFCGLCENITDHRVIWRNIHLKHEYFTHIDIRDTCFTFERCQYCGVISTLPPLSLDELKKYYTCQYEAHSQLHQEIKRSLSLLMRMRNNITKPFLSFFFIKSSMISNLLKRILISCFFPRMFRGFPVLVTKPQTLLDIGCGDGSFLYHMRKMPCKGYGYEISQAAVKTAQEAGLNVRMGTIENLAEVYSDQRFDVIRLIDVLEHTPNPGKIIRSVYNLLNKNGEIIICVPNFISFSRHLLGKFWPVLHLPFHRFHFTPSVIKKILEKNGFTVKIIFTKNTLQVLYGIEYFLQHKNAAVKIVNTFTKLIYTPFDVFFDIIFPLWGDSIEIHAIRDN